MHPRSSLLLVALALATLFGCSFASTPDAATQSLVEARANAETVAIDGLSIRVRRSVRENAPALVLLGPYPQSIRAWDAAWPALADRYDLLAMDLPGFGLSEGRPDTMSPSAAGGVVLATATHFGLDRFHLVGPDVGVPVALWISANHPERVASANVFDGPGFFPPEMEPQLDQLVHSGFARWMAGNVVADSAMDQFYAIATHAGYSVASASESASIEYHAITHDPTAHRLALAYLASYESELEAIGRSLPKISRPILITWGRDDAFVLPSNGERMNALIPASRLVVFDGAGHYSHEDAGERYIETLVDWIDGGHLAVTKPTGPTTLNASVH